MRYHFHCSIETNGELITKRLPSIEPIIKAKLEAAIEILKGVFWLSIAVTLMQY